jgi:hypothetical protein
VPFATPWHRDETSVGVPAVHFPADVLGVEHVRAGEIEVFQ